jgi:hypothetical protein
VQHMASPNLVPRESKPIENADEQRARELIKRVRKLRWIGEDDLARQVAGELLAAAAGVCVIATPETD